MHINKKRIASFERQLNFLKTFANEQSLVMFLMVPQHSKPLIMGMLVSSQSHVIVSWCTEGITEPSTLSQAPFTLRKPTEKSSCVLKRIANALLAADSPNRDLRDCRCNGPGSPSGMPTRKALCLENSSLVLDFRCTHYVI